MPTIHPCTLHWYLDLYTVDLLEQHQGHGTHDACLCVLLYLCAPVQQTDIQTQELPLARFSAITIGDHAYLLLAIPVASSGTEAEQTTCKTVSGGVTADAYWHQVACAGHVGMCTCINLPLLGASAQYLYMNHTGATCVIQGRCAKQPAVAVAMRTLTERMLRDEPLPKGRVAAVVLIDSIVPLKLRCRI
jgi:hypothetical protein